MNRSTNKNHIAHITKTTGPYKSHIPRKKKRITDVMNPPCSETHRTWAEYKIIGPDRKSNAAPFTPLDFPA